MKIKKSFQIGTCTINRKGRIYAMVWKNLDLDLVEEIQFLEKGEFLDLGTGPGTQAIELTKRGFHITGSDVSSAVIGKVWLFSSSLNFIIDDILNSKFQDESFDYILDEGCFYVLSDVKRVTYLRQTKRILKKNGIFF